MLPYYYVRKSYTEDEHRSGTPVWIWETALIGQGPLEEGPLTLFTVWLAAWGLSAGCWLDVGEPVMASPQHVDLGTMLIIKGSAWVR